MNMPAKIAEARRPGVRKGVLSGVRIADFTWVAAGPLATRFLADMGAEVIKIEDGRPGHPRIDRIRRVTITRGTGAKSVGHDYGDFNLNSSGMFNNYNRSKLSVTIDMTHPRGRELAERLIAQCSVVTENFAPGVMEHWGLTYERLNEISPEIIFARMCGFGHSGPYEMFRSYGPVVQAVSGLSHISGLPGGGMPSGWGMSYMDNQAGYQGSNGILAALYRRNATGRGSLVDLSAVEAGVSLIGPKMLDVTVNGAVTRGGDFPCGNRLPDNDVAPHGVYPSRGDDQWIAIAVMEDGQWAALRAAMGDPEWAVDPRFETGAGRAAAQDELDARMAEWTADQDKHALAQELQRAEVPAMAIQNESDKEHDPQLDARGLYVRLDHPVCGPSRFEGTPIKFSRSAPDLWRSAPFVGEDNDYVFREIMKMDPAEIVDLREAGVI